MNNLKNKRGFSLVELMVVVAIMGTLAAIAIPAYNSYRKAAKKTAYKSDLMGLHKGWLAFGVELDSFCERETQPAKSTISSIGMQSLLSSRLYGETAAATCDHDVFKSSTCTTAPTGCTVNSQGTNCTGTLTGGNHANCRSGSCSSAFVPARTGGPGKDSFIGFGDSTCAGGIINRHIKSSTTTVDTDCELNTTDYEIGVYGQLSGTDGYGVSINHNGVISSEVEATLATTADSGC